LRFEQAPSPALPGRKSPTAVNGKMNAPAAVVEHDDAEGGKSGDAGSEA